MKDIKSEWDQLIEAKLKADKKISDLSFNYGSNIIMPPNIVGHNNYRSVPIANNRAWLNMASIEATTASEFNHLIHLALNQGANGLDLVLKSDFDPNEILEGVLTEYLDVRIRSNKDINVEYLSNSLDSMKYPNVRWVGPKSSTEEIHIVECRIESIKSLLFTIDHSKNYDVIVKVGKNILFEISLLRALRLELTSKRIATFNIIATYDIEGKNQLGDYNLIEQTYKVMSAIMGNADAVLTKFKGDENSRLSLNIHNVLELESNFKSVLNPIQGSYYIEELTEKIRQQLS